ncbi:MAG: low temperature requirement protein A, partial [Actinomycetota bacterium]|nr:low temperature requirement protein A [Actinomycetota bacterium]
LVPAVGLFGGIALYYAGHIAFRLRNVGTLNRQRLVAALLCVALIPLAVEVDALVALAVAAAITSGLVGYEALHFAEARRRLRGTAH